MGWLTKQTVAMVLIIFSVQGCQTTNLANKVTQGVSNQTENISKNLSSSISSLNPFTKRERDFHQFIAEKKYRDAEKLLVTEYRYFEEYFSENDKAELYELADYIWRLDFSRFDVQLAQTESCSPKNHKNWNLDNSNVRNTEVNISKIKKNKTLRMAAYGADKIRDAQKAVSNCKKLYTNYKTRLVGDYFEDFVNGKLKIGSYLVAISSSDFQRSGLVQQKIMNSVDKSSHTRIESSAKHFRQDWLSNDTKSKIDKLHAASVRQSFVDDGKITLEDAIRFQSNGKGIFGTIPAADPLIRFGFVDLDQSNNKGSENTDFKSEVKLDIDFPIENLTNRQHDHAVLNGFDWLLFKQTISSDVNRKFSDKSTPTSKFQIGTRQVANPAYPAAFNEYQTALMRQAQAEADNSLTNSCSGTGNCLAAGFVQGLAKAAARKRAEEAAANLGNTPQTLIEPVYENYSYRLVDIKVDKKSLTKIGLVDLKDQTLRSDKNLFESGKNFTVAYGLNDADPQKNKIENRHDDEQDITNFEKRTLTISANTMLSKLKRKDAVITKLPNVSDVRYLIESFYENKKRKIQPSQNKSSSSGVIADDRFNSVVVIETGTGLGTGFYISNTYVLTAYHVVEGSSILKITTFDGHNASGRVVAHDIRLDLALVKVDRSGPPLKIYSGPLPLGSSVEAIGHPQGLTYTITRGVISALRKQESVYTKGSNLVEFVQSDTPISPGNSGGPLFLGNTVIGVADWGNVEAYTQNLNFSVSYNEVNEFIEKSNLF